MLGLLYLFLTAGALIALVGAAAVLYRLMHPPRRTLAAALAWQLPADPGELGLTFTEQHFRLADGSTSPGWVIEGRRRDGPVLIVTHGFGDSRFGAMWWAVLLLDFASRVAVYDLRGHGDSTAARSRPGMGDVDDLLAVMDQVHGNEPVVLFGHSLGAGVSIAVAAQHPERVLGVIADGPYRYWSEPIVGLMRLHGWPARLFVIPAGLILLAAGVPLWRFDRAKLASRLRCPLLVLHGREDPLCPIESARAIVAAAADATLVEFDGAGHGDLASVDQPRYIDALTTFFDRLARPAATADEEEKGLAVS